jgi:putative toxin-antitoxin system antitoxin component (TIGR02293 family)
MPTTKKFSFSSSETDSSSETEEDLSEDWRSLSYRWMGGDRVLETRFGHRLTSELDWAEAIEEGLPTEALEAAMDQGTLSWKEIGELVIPRRTFSHRKEKGEPLTPEESDRLVRLLRAVAKAKETFQNDEKAERWLKKENRALGGRTPLEALKTESGARLVENVLGRIAHGVYS